MHRRVRIGLFLAVVLAVLAPLALPQPTGKTPADRDRAALKGKWKVVKVDSPNKDDRLLRGMTATVVEDRLTINKPGETAMTVRILSLDPGKSPKTIVCRHRGQKNATAGIYDLKNDEFQLCLAEPGSAERPTDFSGKTNAAFTLKRFGPADEAREALQGRWQVVAAQGKTTGPVGAVVTFEGDTFRFGDSALKGTIVSVEPSKEPNEPSEINLQIDAQKESTPGIYQLSDAELRLCLAEAGAKDRPKSFSDLDRVYTLRRVIDDAQFLQGKWEVEFIERDLKQNIHEAPQKDKSRWTMLFFGNRVKTMLEDKVTNDTTFKVDVSKRPRSIDFIDKWERDKAMLGIFELNIDRSKGDTLKLCLARQTSYPRVGSKDGKDEFEDTEWDRPTEFIPGKDNPVIRLKRVHIEPGDLFGFREDKRYLDPEQDWLKLRKIVQLLQMFEAEKKVFPAAAICNDKAEPLLSWRVALLPYLNQDRLYKEFKLDEPWDSAHNKKLIVKIPDLYVVPMSKTAKLGETHYRLLGGGGAVFDLVKGTKAADITDGFANTLAVVQAAEAVPWTRPEVLAYNPNGAMPEFAEFYGEGKFLGAFFDGHLQLFDTKVVPQKTLRALITKAGGEQGPFDLGPPTLELKVEKRK
jgi:uncharacterized protein (TIGR03067 family)